MAGKSPKWDPVPEVEEDEMVLTPPRGVEVTALKELDRLNPCLIFEQRASLMNAQILEGPVQECTEVCFGECDCAG